MKVGDRVKLTRDLFGLSVNAGASGTIKETSQELSKTPVRWQVQFDSPQMCVWIYESEIEVIASKLENERKEEQMSIQMTTTYTCNRCGEKKTVPAILSPSGDKFNFGGMPDDWGKANPHLGTQDTKQVIFCPECDKEFNKFMHD